MKKLLSVSIVTMLFFSACSYINPEMAMKKGFEIYEKGQYVKAFDHLKRAYENGVENGTLYFRLGYCYHNVKNNRKQAIIHYEEAISWYAENPKYDVVNYKKAYFNCGVAHFELGNNENDMSKKMNHYQIGESIWQEGLNIHSDNKWIKSGMESMLHDIKQKLRREGIDPETGKKL